MRTQLLLALAAIATLAAATPAGAVGSPGTWTWRDPAGTCLARFKAVAASPEAHGRNDVPGPVSVSRESEGCAHFLNSPAGRISAYAEVRRPDGRISMITTQGDHSGITTTLRIQ